MEKSMVVKMVQLEFELERMMDFSLEILMDY